MAVLARARHPGFWPFLAWAATGAGLAVAIAGVLTIGVFVLPVVIVAVAVLVRWHGSRNASAIGLLSGLGVIPLFIAYLNRGGPGMVCTTSATGQTCTGEWSPWPFAAAGILLIAAGVIGYQLLRTRRAR
jgi:hypothetical protein